MALARHIYARLSRIPVFGSLLQRFLGLIRPTAQLLLRPLLMRRYLRKNPVPRLHIGASGYGHEGWLNVDLHPVHWNVLPMDASRSFPLPEDSFKYVHSEHMIEHISLHDAQRMLTECYRILKRNGRIRLATPDFTRVIQLAAKSPSLAAQSYLKWSREHHGFPAGLPAATLTVNRLFSGHGHCFLYDEETLSQLLREAGFSNVRRHVPGQSDDPILSQLEIHHLVIGVETNCYETLVLEAEKA